MKIDSALKKRLKAAVIEKLREEKSTTVIVETPYVLTEEQKDVLYGYLPQLKDKKLINKVVPSLIGGFVIKFNSEVIDVSIRNEINTVVSNLTQV